MIKFAQVGQYKLIFDQLHALVVGRNHLLRLLDIGGEGDDGAFEKGCRLKKVHWKMGRPGTGVEPLILLHPFRRASAVLPRFGDRIDDSTCLRTFVNLK